MNFLKKRSYDIGYGAAVLVWPFFRKRRRISVENILKCGITSDMPEAKRIARKSFCHFVGHIVEALAVPSVVNKDNWREHFDMSEADPELEKVLFGRPDTPILIVSGHHGAWEAATSIISLNRPMIVIVRMMNSKFLQNWLETHHFRGEVTMISRNDGLCEKVMRQWQEEKSAMTILMDQHTYGGSMLKFFGRPARTVTSAARLAVRYGFPVAVGSFVRVGPFKYRAVAGKPIVFEKGTDRDVAAQILNDRIEEAIRKYPEQYLWMHRRWRDD